MLLGTLSYGCRQSCPCYKPRLIHAPFSCNVCAARFPFTTDLHFLSFKIQAPFLQGQRHDFLYEQHFSSKKFSFTTAHVTLHQQCGDIQPTFSNHTCIYSSIIAFSKILCTLIAFPIRHALRRGYA